jgi:tRNA(Arg) A34 adenosine deaminase TadA
MAEAIRLATENARSGRGGPFAAIIVRDGEIVSRGTNLVTSTNDPTAHAEVVAIRGACTTLHTFQLSDCKIYTSCEPCPMCLGAIYWAHLATVYFGCTREDAASAGFDDSLIYQEIQAPLDARKIPMQSCMRDEALESFRAWQELQDKIPY